MDTDTNEEQMQQLLHDDAYEVLKKDPTEDKRNKLKQLLKNFMEDQLKKRRVTPTTSDTLMKVEENAELCQVNNNLKSSGIKELAK